MLLAVLEGLGVRIGLGGTTFDLADLATDALELLLRQVANILYDHLAILPILIII